MNKPNDDIKKITLRHYIVIAVLLGVLLCMNIFHFAQQIKTNNELITNYEPEIDKMELLRNPAVAGLFYESDKTVLKHQIENFMIAADSSSSSSLEMPKIIIVPHAGYVYSAKTAAKAFVLLAKHKNKIKNIIIIGPSHRVALQGAALSSADYFKTPLGKIKVNKDFVNSLLKNNEFKINNKAHEKEHSIEVQLPFVQHIFKNVQIIPIVYGNIDEQKIANAIYPLMQRDDTVAIVSADLSHYYESSKAKLIDKNTAKRIEKNQKINTEMSCGATGINAALILAKQNHLKPSLIELINSGDITGDNQSVVGYGAWSFVNYQKTNENISKIEKEAKSLQQFAQKYGADLLRIAHTALDEAVLNNKTYNPKKSDFDIQLFNKGASFVTLKKNGKLRGCIGSIMSETAIASDIAKNTFNAAKNDRRMEPISQEELKSLELSVSLLTSFEEINFSTQQDLLDKLNPKVDGLILQDGNRVGLFLPSVWLEIPNKTDFLNNLKIKAGLTPNYWSENIKIYRFRTVEIKKNEN